MDPFVNKLIMVAPWVNKVSDFSSFSDLPALNVQPIVKYQILDQYRC